MIKSWDVNHKRMGKKIATSLQDMCVAEFIRIDNDSREFTCRQLNEWGEFGLYEGGEMVGYIRPSVKKQVEISIRKHGLLFKVFVKYTKIKCYAKS